MSCPKSDQAVDIIDRIKSLLDEWDDASYYIVIKNDEGNYMMCSKLNVLESMLLSKSLISEGIKNAIEEGGGRYDENETL